MRFLLTTIILLANFQIYTLKGQEASISMNLKNATLIEFIQNIENQTNYYFIYQDELINIDNRFDIKFENVNIRNSINWLEENLPVNAEIVGSQIILKKRSEANNNNSNQGIVIKGKVVSENNEPLLGVSVIVKGELRGALTNSNGEFQIKLQNDSATLVFSYLGLENLEVPIKNQEDIIVTLKKELIEIEEVVTIGYGVIKKTENTGSIASLKAKTLNELPITTLEEGLKGKLTGVQITPSSGQPGAGMSVRIRGVSSLAGANEPLYVIDGVPTFNNDVRDLNGLSGYNPSDITLVEVLKDAIATSIYGSRAANGVILITTKKGYQGKVKVTYDSFLALQTVRKKLPLMNGEGFINYATEYYTNAKNISEDQRSQNLNAINIYGNAETDWQDEVLRNALYHGQNITFSGGSEKSTYFTSINYTNQEGIVSNTDFTKYGFRFNLNNNITRWLDVNSRTSFSRVIQNGFLAGDGTNTRNSEKSGIGATVLVPSTISVYDDNGDYSPVDVYPFSYDVMDNPVAMLEALDKNTMHYLISGLDINTKLLTGITNTMRLGVEYVNRTHDYYLPSVLTQLGSQTAEIHETKIWSNLFENFFTLKKNFFEDLKFEMVAGFSAQWDNYQSINVSGTGFPSDNLINSSIQAAKSVSVPITEKSRTTLASFFGRINLGLYHKYHLSLSTRYDGSSVFSENDKWATFPAIGFAWRINEEDFINNTNISNFKLRTSWGLSGNQAINPYQSIYVGNVVNTGQGAGSGINVGIAPTLPNKNLTWETTEQYNLGLDFGIIKDRIYFVFDYYLKNTKDLLANIALPGSSGFSYYVDNVGAVQNKGIELTIGTGIIRNENTSLSIDFNYSQNRNEVKETKNNLDIIPSSTDDATRTQEIVRVGEPIFSFYMPKFLGLDDTGTPQYEDLNNDGVIDSEDNQIVGNPFPDFFYGADINMSYKHISLKMSWQGVNGARLNNALLHSLTTPEPITNRVKNIKEYYPYLSDEYVVWNSDRFIEDASFLRLKNIKLTYTFSDVFKIINELHVYASAQNILTITNYSGYDPEVNSFSNRNQLQGVDYSAFPYAKSIMVGLNFVF